MQLTTTISPFIDVFDRRKNSANLAKPFLVAEHAISYGEVVDRIERTATLFEELGLGKDDRALIASEQDTEIATLVLAMWRCGITAVPVNPHSSADEFRNMIAKSSSKALFVDKDIQSKLNAKDKDLFANSTVVSIESPQPKSLFDRFRKTDVAAPASYPALLKSKAPSRVLPADIPASTVAYVLFTSGTTSEPKGVQITHGNLMANLDTLQRQYQLTDATRWLNILPLHHADGLVQGPLFMFAVGGTCFRPMTFQLNRLEELLNQIYKLRITHWLTVPTVVALALEFGRDYRDAFDTSDFEFAISTAGHLDESIWRQFEKRFQTRLVNVYGLTETVCEAFYCGPDEETRRIGTIGKPVDVEAKVVDSSGEEVDPGEVGELLLRGDNIMEGYLEMPTATDEVLKDGWLFTGDLVRTDRDGFFEIVGRKKNLIISGGLNVYPEEVASVLRKIPGVMDAVVFGVDDAHWGERVVACVETNPSVSLTVASIREQFQQHASADLTPHSLMLTSELPRGPSGKVILDQAKALLESDDATTTDDRDKVEDRVIATAARVFGVTPDELSLASTRETTEAWTSLAHVDLIMSIEKAFHFRFESRDVMTIRALRDIADVVGERAEQ